MNWNKLKKQLEGFICDELKKHITYSPTGYRYSKDKKTQAYILVDKREVFNVNKNPCQIVWFTSEAEVKKSLTDIFVPEHEIEAIRVSHPNVPDDRLLIIARNKLAGDYAHVICKAQVNLLKSNFQELANTYLSTSLNKCFESDDIIINILALIDRRVGKNKLRKLEYQMKVKHPLVQYFYQLRKDA